MWAGCFPGAIGRDAEVGDGSEVETALETDGEPQPEVETSAPETDAVEVDTSEADSRETDTAELNACGGPGVLTPGRCAEPAGGCEVPLTCDELAFGAGLRACSEGAGDNDASCGACLPTYVEVGGECRGEVVAPVGVAATNDLEDRIVVSWGAVTHATGDRVFRCFGSCGDAGPRVELVPVPNAQTSFPDETSSALSAPPAPAVSATANRPVDVQVSWAAVVAPLPPVYSERVVAIGPSGPSAPSTIALGQLVERPITGYEVSMDGGAWQAVEATVFVDAGAAAPTLVAGAVTASQGGHADKVVVSLATRSSPDGASRESRVRAKTRFGVGAFGVASGRRKAGELTLSWERSASSAPADFGPIAGSAGPVQSARNFEDLDPLGIPPDGVVRYYRAHARLSYQVRGQFSGGTTPSSTTANGRRATGTISRAWEYASPGNPTAFATSSTAICATSSTSCNDTSASPLRAKRIYRATLSAPGATSLTTNTMEGWRLAFTHGDGGSDAMCAIDTNGRLWAWGQFNGQSSLVPRIRAQGPFVACTSGGSQLSYDGVGFGCARTSLGDVSRGSLLVDNPLLQRVNLGTGVKSIEVREAHGCAVKGNGQTVCWGLGVFGQLAHNAVTDSPTPVTVVRSTGAALTGLEEVDVGTLHSCARTSSGSAWCWGGNGSGQLGDGTQAKRQFAVQVPSLSGCTEITLGEEHTCVRLSSGEVVCVGANDLGQLGNGTRQARWSPAAVLLAAAPDVRLTGVIEIAALDSTTCVRRLADTLCWGSDGGGEPGNGGANQGSLVPLATTLAGQASDRGAGRWTICAIVDG